jgi:hypothetical protein
MPIDTEFRFAHRFAAGTALAADLLGPLRGFVGNQHQRTWKGTGFNLIWRPNHGQSGPADFFLELNLTEETLDFTDITGSGIANRGLLQTDIALGGLAYLQQISDKISGPQHFEPGVWANVPNTTNPQEKSTVVRMGSIPHGTTINLQGDAFPAPGSRPQIDPTTIIPFTGTLDDGICNLVHFPGVENNIATDNASRTPHNQVPGLTEVQLTNPNSFLTQANANLTFLSTTVIALTSDLSAPKAPPNAPPDAPDVGGGTDNIAFLTGKTGGPNAVATRVTATFWIERVKDAQGNQFDQLQYTQRVLLNFNQLNWPHITVATLR